MAYVAHSVSSKAIDHFHASRGLSGHEASVIQPTRTFSILIFLLTTCSEGENKISDANENSQCFLHIKFFNTVPNVYCFIGWSLICW